MSATCPNWSGVFADFLKSKNITIDNNSWKTACEKFLAEEGLNVGYILNIDSKKKLNDLAEKIYNKYFTTESLNDQYIYETGDAIDVCNGVIGNSQSDGFDAISSKIYEKIGETANEIESTRYYYEPHDNILINTNGAITTDVALKMVVDYAISFGCTFTVLDTKQNTSLISYLKEKRANFKILKQSKKSNINISSIPVVNPTPTDGSVLSFEEKADIFVKELQFASKNTVRDPNFSENHKREVWVNGKKEKVTKSVSDLVHKDQPKSKKEEGLSPYIAQAGNTFDKLVRMYFLKGRDTLKASDYPEFNEKEFSLALKIINNFDSVLKNTDGIGMKDGVPQKYKVISQEFDFTAKINGEYVSGTPDLIIYTESGDYFICDIKTVGLNSGSDFNKRWSNVIDSYKEQVSWYNVLMQKNELGKAAGVFFFPVGVQYQMLPNGSGIKNGTLVINPGNQNIYSDDRFEIYSQLSFSKTSISSVLSQEEIATLKELSGKLTQKQIDDIVKKEQEKAQVQERKQEQEKEKEQETHETINGNDVLVEANKEPVTICPVTAKEQIKVSNNLAKTILWYNDQLSNPNAEYHETLWKELYGIDKSEFKDSVVYSSVVNNKMSIINTFDQICTYLITEMFNEGINYDDEKTIYIANNFNDILLKSSKILLKLGKIEISKSSKEVEKAILDNDETTQEGKESEGKEVQYDIDKRTISVINTMAEDLRNKLSKIILKKYDKEGNIINAYSENSEIARTVLFDFVSVQEIVSDLIQKYGYIEDSETLVNTIYDDVVKGRDGGPAWLEQVYSLISNNAQLRTQLLNSIRKSESNYQHINVTQLDKNKNKVEEVDEENQDELSGAFVVKIVNSLDETTYYNEMNKIYRMFASCRNYNADDDFHDESLPKLFEMSSKNKFELVVDFDKFPEINFKNFNTSALSTTEKKRYILDILGLDNLFFEDSIDYLNFGPIVRMVQLIKKQNEKGEPFRFYTILDKDSRSRSSSSISQTYSEFLSKNKEYIKPKTETTVKDGDKTYCTHSDPSFIQDVVDEINGNNKSCTKENLFTNEDAKYRRARVHFNKQTGRFVCSWFNTLNELDDKEFECLRKCFQHSINTSVAGNQFKDQTPREKEITLYSNYFMPYIPIDLPGIAENNGVSLNQSLLHRSRVPVMSDKPADENILYLADDISKSSLAKDVAAYVASKYGTETQCFVALNMFEYYLYELDRQKAVVETLLFGDESDDVEKYNIDRNSDAAIKLKESLLSKCSEKYKKQNIFKLKRGAKISDTDKKLLGELISKTRGLQFVYCPFCENDTTLSNSRIKFILEGGEGVIRSAFCTSFIKWMKSQIPSYDDNKVLIESISTSRVNDIYDPITQDSYQDFWFNDYLACCNILNITVGDPAYYKNTIDLQKRFAQVHAMLIKPDTSATFKSNGKNINVSDGVYRSVIISDLHLETKMGEVIISELDKMISDPSLGQEQKKALVYMRDYLSKKDKSGNSVLSYISEATDGQSYAGPTAFFKKLKMLGEDTTELEIALKRIKRGKYNIGDIKKFCVQEFKSFIYAPVDKMSPNHIGLEPVPTQIKHSEAMILVTSIMAQSKNKTPLNALFEFMEETAYDKSGEYNGRGIDGISFRSAVKTGIQGVIDLNGMSYEKALNELRSKCKPNNGTYDKHYVKEFDFSRWGKQQEVPAHMQDHMQGMGSQIKILSISNIPEDWVGTIDGVTYTKETFIKAYFSEISKDMELGIEFISKMLGLDSFDEAEKNRRLSNLLIDTVKKDNDYNPDLEKALEVEDGKFKIPLQDPVISNIVFKTMFSLIKKYVNKEEMFGGPVVQVSPFGHNEKLYATDIYGHKFGDKNFDMSHGVVYKVAITAPTEEIENAITVTVELKKKFANDKEMNKYSVGDLMSMKDIIHFDVLSPEQLEKCKLLAYRIPTEDKYSMFRCEVAEFLPRQGGEAIIMPPEVTVLSGCDFDVDKMYTEFLFDLKKLDDRRTKIMDDYDDGNISEEEYYEETQKINILQKMFASRNKIFKMQWDMLGQKHSTLDHLHPGNFEELKSLAERVPVKENLANKPIMLLQTQLDLYALNAAGKSFVGIAALNNISHSICEMANVYFKVPEGVDFMINGKRFSEIYPNGEVKADPMYSPFDSMKISRTIGMFVGASADNAKEAVLGKLNITPLTANIAVAMMRLGFPLDIIVGILTNDTVIDLCNQALDDDVRFESVINRTYNELILKNNNFDEQIGDVDFRLEKNTKDNQILLDKKIQPHQIIILLHDLCHFANGYSHINNITSLNSVKNAVGPNIWDTIATGIKLENSLNTDDDYFVKDKGIRTLMEDIPHLKTLYRCYTGIDGQLGLLETLTRDISTVFNPDFQLVLTIAKDASLMSIEYPQSDVIKQLHDDWLIYKAHFNGFLTESSFASLFDKIEKAKSEDTTENNFLYYLLDLFDETHKVGNIRYGIKSVKLNDVHTLSPEQKAELTEGWKDLLNNEKTHELAKDIFKYFMFRFGFSLTSRNALTISPADVRVALSTEDNYDKLFNSLHNSMFDIDSFMVQFMFNHPNLCPRIPMDVIQSAKEHNWKLVDKDECNKSGYGIYATKSGKLWYIDFSDESTNLLKIQKPNRLGGRDLLEYRIFGNNEDTASSLVENGGNRIVIRYSHNLSNYDTSESEYESQDEEDTTNKNTMSTIDNETNIITITSTSERNEQGRKRLMTNLGLSETQIKLLEEIIKQIC